MNNYSSNRKFMKSSYDGVDVIETADIAKGIPQPAFQNPIPNNTKVIDLPPITKETAPKKDYYECISSRISRREYSDKALTLFELSFLLWCTQGVKKVIGGYRKYIKDGSGRNYLRFLAAGGSINAYETYLAIMNVEGVDIGIWRYLPLTHQIVFISEVEELSMKISDIFTNKSQNQSYTAKSGVVFFWACNPYRGEWRYKETSHKIMLIDLGHISHQLYLATEVLDCGCCSIGGYNQHKADELICVDGDNEYTVLCASVGHVVEERKNWLDNFPDIRDNPEFYGVK